MRPSDRLGRSPTSTDVVDALRRARGAALRLGLGRLVLPSRERRVGEIRGSRLPRRTGTAPIARRARRQDRCASGGPGRRGSRRCGHPSCAAPRARCRARRAVTNPSSTRISPSGRRVPAGASSGTAWMCLELALLASIHHVSARTGRRYSATFARRISRRPAARPRSRRRRRRPARDRAGAASSGCGRRASSPSSR